MTNSYLYGAACGALMKLLRKILNPQSGDTPEELMFYICAIVTLTLVSFLIPGMTEGWVGR